MKVSYYYQEATHRLLSQRHIANVSSPLPGEGNFDDNRASGAATPTTSVQAGNQRKRPTAKKAKTTKQRLAIADGQMDI